MWKKIAGSLALAGAAYLTYNSYRAGYFTRPEMPPGAFSLSFKNGLRGILHDIPDERLDRKYLGYPFEVAPWFESAWADCDPPTENEIEKVVKSVNLGSGTRLDAICKITADEDTIVRGVIFSAPRRTTTPMP